jgi:hypothetical protein
MDGIRDIRASDSEINKTPNKMAITCGIRKKLTISRSKLNSKLHRSLSDTLITKISPRKKILNILFLGDKEAIGCRRNLNPKKVAKRTKIRHEKLLTETCLNKGNVLRVITSDDHVINIEKQQGPTPRRGVDKQCWIMSTGREASGNNHRGETLKPGTRSLFETI